MIGRLRGTIVAKHADRIVLDVSGVGYEIFVTPHALVELPGIGEEAVLHAHLHVREDQLAVYGFPSDDQRDMFRVLLAVSGIGPKVALAILGTMSTDELRRAVMAEDAAALTLVPGIGTRSAQKLMLELRPRMELGEAAFPSAGGALAEVREALEGLGYQSAEVSEAVRGLPPDVPVEDMLRHALRELGRIGRS